MALPVRCSKYAFQSGWSFYFNTLLHPPPAPVQAEDRRQECRLPSHSPGLESRTAGPPILCLISSTPCMWVFLYTIKNCSLNFTSFFYLSPELTQLLSPFPSSPPLSLSPLFFLLPLRFFIFCLSLRQGLTLAETDLRLILKPRLALNPQCNPLTSASPMLALQAHIATPQFCLSISAGP